MKKLLLPALLLLTLLTQAQAKDFDLVMEYELGFGGDTLLVDENNDNILSMGDGLLYAIGTRIKTLASRDDLHTALTAGFNISMRTDTDAGITTLLRFPITLTQYFDINQWQLGAGATYHIGHKFYGNDNLPDIKFDNALGTLLSVGYAFGTKQLNHVGIRATFIDYEAEHTSNSISGNRVALFGTAHF